MPRLVMSLRGEASLRVVRPVIVGQRKSKHQTDPYRVRLFAVLARSVNSWLIYVTRRLIARTPPFPHPQTVLPAGMDHGALGVGRRP